MLSTAISKFLCYLWIGNNIADIWCKYVKELSLISLVVFVVIHLAQLFDRVAQALLNLFKLINSIMCISSGQSLFSTFVV